MSWKITSTTRMIACMLRLVKHDEKMVEAIYADFLGRAVGGDTRFQTIPNLFRNMIFFVTYIQIV